MEEMQSKPKILKDLLEALWKDSKQEESFQQKTLILRQVVSTVTLCRRQGMNNISAWLVGVGLEMVGMTINTDEIPNNLSEEDKSLVLQLFQELSIVAFYVDFPTNQNNGAHEICHGLRISELLLFAKSMQSQDYVDLSNINKTMIQINEYFYVNQLPTEKRTQVPITMPLINENSPERYRPMNPSILKTESGFLVLCRGINYDQQGAVNFTSLDHDRMIRTRNFLIVTDREFSPISTHEIIDKTIRHKYPTCVLGLEDCHLAEVEGTIWFTCVTLDTNPHGKTQISLCKLPEETNKDGNYEVIELTPLIGPDLRRNEKNWLPFSHDGKLAMIYGYDPLTIKVPTMIDLKATGETTNFLEMGTHIDFSRFRGSAGPIKFPYDGYQGELIVIHEVILRNEGRCYTHRFVWLDQNFAIGTISPPWFIDHKGIEFCKSLVFNHSDDKLILGVGIEDREAWIYQVSIDVVSSLLHPVKSF